MVAYRQERLNDLLKSTIAEILCRSIKDPRIGLVTITNVRVSKDLRSAKVFVSQLGSNEEKHNSLTALQRAAKFIQCEAGNLLRLKYTPKLEFKVDQNIEYAMKITDMIDELAVSGENDTFQEIANKILQFQRIYIPFFKPFFFSNFICLLNLCNAGPIMSATSDKAVGKFWFRYCNWPKYSLIGSGFTRIYVV